MCICFFFLIYSILHLIKGYIWLYSISVLLLKNPMKRSSGQVLCVFKPDVSSSSVPQSAIKNTSISNTVALTDMFLHYHEYAHCTLFWPTCQILTISKCNAIVSCLSNVCDKLNKEITEPFYLVKQHVRVFLRIYVMLGAECPRQGEVRFVL